MARPSYSAGGAADVTAWVAKVGERLEYIGKESVRDLAVEVRTPVSQGGNMPVRTGNLRNSLKASTTGVPSATYMPADTERLADPMSQINSVINTSTLGDKISLGFSVAYALYVVRKYMFVDLAAMKWSQIVRNVVDEAKRKIP